MGQVEQRLGDNSFNELFVASDLRTSPDFRFTKAEGGFLRVAQDLVVACYNRFTSNGIDEEEVRRELVTQDGYVVAGRTTTFIATLDNDLVVAGTMRFTLGAPAVDGLPAIDAMNWMTNSVPWPHEQENIDVRSLGEIGRFATISGQYWPSKAESLQKKKEITWGLFYAIAQHARQQGVQMIYAIMPRKVARLTTMAGMDVEEVEGVGPRWEEDELEALAARYPGYWNEEKMKPRLFVLHFPQEV